MQIRDVIVTKVWWSRKFVLRWRYDFMGFWRTADLFDTLDDAHDARARFIKANGLSGA